MDAKSRLDALTGLRFVACFVVAVNHLAGAIPELVAGPVVPFLRHAGNACIPLFFALSGFVLGYSYLERLQNPTRPAVRDYLIARAARVYPVHVLVFGLCLAIPYSPLSGLTAFGLAAQLLLVHVWGPVMAVTASVNGVTWTLGVEVFLYLCLPGMLWLAGRRPSGPWRYLLLAGLLIAVQAVLVLAAGRSPGMKTMWAMVFFPLGRLFEFGAGVLLGLAFEGLRARRWAESPATRSGVATATLLEVAVGVLVLGAVYAGVRWSAHLAVGGPYTLAAAAVILVLALGARVAASYGESVTERCLPGGVVPRGYRIGLANGSGYLSHVEQLRGAERPHWDHSARATVYTTREAVTAVIARLRTLGVTGTLVVEEVA